MIRSILRWVAWLLVCAVAVVTLAPIDLRPVTAVPANWERFAAFTAIGALLAMGYPQHLLRIVVLVVALAGCLEVMQHLSPTRHGTLPDGLVKALGALLGVALAVGARHGFKRLRVPANRRPLARHSA